MKIKDAVRAPIAIPLYFEPVFLDSSGHTFKNYKKNSSLNVVVDGGIIGNFPIAVFDSTINNTNGIVQRIPNAKTIGVRIDTDEQIALDKTTAQLAPLPIKNAGNYITALYTIIIENLNRSQLLPTDWQRTISVSSAGIGPKIKKLSAYQKQLLVHSGEAAAHDFFNNKNVTPVP